MATRLKPAGKWCGLGIALGRMLVFNWLKSGIPEGTVILRRNQESVEMIFPRFHDRAKKFNWRPVTPIGGQSAKPLHAGCIAA